MKTNTKIIIGLILAATVTRLMPHYPNFTAVGALAFYGAYNSKNLLLSIAALFGTLMLTDVIINNVMYPSGDFVLLNKGSLFIYTGFAAYSFLGLISKNVKQGALMLIAGSMLFFLLSNLGVWMSPYSLFPRTGAGLMSTYVAAVPFYAPELLATALFSTIAHGAHVYFARTANA